MSEYYTPEIEEFHVGFKYESFEFPFQSREVWDLPEPEWVKKTVLDINKSEFGSANYHVSIYNNYEKNVDWNKNIRVKYLDKEGIEDLGFIREMSSRSEVLDSSCDLYISEEKNIMLAHYPNLNKITICTRDYSKNEVTLKSNWDDRMINLITIKNKTELQKLMKQLGL